MKIKSSTNFHVIKQLLLEDNTFNLIGNNSIQTLLFKGSSTNKNLFSMGNLREVQCVSDVFYNFDYGIAILIRENEIIIFNDRFGAYPLFINKDIDGIQIVDNLNYLSKEILKEYDELSIVDYYLFHHVVGQNTLHQNIKRIPGHSMIKIDNDCNIEVKKNPADYGIFGVDKISDSLALSNQLSLGKSNHKTFLTLTGGYDSRLLLSLLLSENADFETLTWGIKGNLQTEVAKELSKNFNLIHHEIELGNDFTVKIPQYIRQIFEKTPDSPFILDMPQFIYYSDLIAEKYGAVDIVTGFMGSELLRGPSYSSEVLLTKFVADLYRTKDDEQLKKLILDKLINSKLFKTEFVYDNINSLAERYVLYSSVGYENLNSDGQVDYLLKEKYGKLYGQIIRLHNDSINLINPYLNAHFVSNQTSRKFNNKTLYYNSKLLNFLSYRYYAQLINEIYPELLETKVDKGGFKLKDLLTIMGIVKIFYHKYFLDKKSVKRKKYSPPIDYSYWLKGIVIGTFNSERYTSFPALNYANIQKIVRDHYDSLSTIDKNSLIVLAGLQLFDRHIKDM